MKRTLLQYWEGSKAYLLFQARSTAGLPNFVEQDEANRRAAICAVCPLNQPIEGKISKQADKVMLKQVDGRTTPLDSQLQNCAACSCPLKLSVHLHPDLLRVTKSQTEFFEGVKTAENTLQKLIHPECWQAQILSN